MALARKWRPKTFSEVVGQDHVVETLTHALAQQRLHHAYLFAGTRGVGKTTLGRIFAKALNCEQGITAEPCGRCDACRAIDEGRFVDLIEIDAASRTKVEDTRELLDNVQFLPAAGRFKVYLIDEVHMLSTHSFNALLKTLEEPPEHVKFILATTDPHKLPVTVLSRCLKFTLRRLVPAQISAHLKRILQAEAIEAEDAAISLIAHQADGSVRDALSLLDQAIAQGGGRVTEAGVRAMLGLTDVDQLQALLSALAEEDGAALAAAFAQLARQGVDYERLLDALIEQFHLISLLQLLGQAADDQDVTLARHFVEAFTPQRVQLCYQTGLLGQKDMQWSPDARVAFEMTLLRMLAFEPVTHSGQMAEKNAQDRPKTAKNAAEGAKKALKSASSGKPESEKNTTSEISGGPPLEPALDDAPLIEEPTGEAALEGETKQSMFARMRAQLGGGGRRGKDEPAPQAAPAASEDPVKLSVEIDHASDDERLTASATQADASVPERMESQAERVAAADWAEVRWLTPEQWAERIDALGLDGLVRELAEQCVAAEGADGWVLAVAPEFAALRRSRGDALAQRLGRVRWVDWPEGGQSVAQWQARQAEQRHAAAREAFVSHPMTQKIIEQFDGRVIEASIQPKD